MTKFYLLLSIAVVSNVFTACKPQKTESVSEVNAASQSPSIVQYFGNLQTAFEDACRTDGLQSNQKTKNGCKEFAQAALKKAGINANNRGSNFIVACGSWQLLVPSLSDATSLRLHSFPTEALAREMYEGHRRMGTAGCRLFDPKGFQVGPAT
ncbi:hypothetical protein EBR21_13465 [bacterium]|nr:hypothetical protein [bacterium]